MLVLTREEKQAVIITASNGEKIVVTLCRIDGGRTRMGFTAPPEVHIVRAELEGRAA